MATSSGITSLYCTNGNGLIFDFETEQFTDSFRYAIGIDQKIKFAPKLRVACVYNLNTGKYTYYRPGTTDKLIARLLNADFIVSFNGKCFDLLVLQRHHRLGKRKADQLNRKHIDLCEEVKTMSSRRWSLNKLARLNLGEAKHTNGREMTSLNLAALKIACRSDVSQTYRIFLKWMDGSLMIPKETSRRAATVDIPLIHHHLPNPFPYNYIDLDLDDMTEGQMAEYLAGTWGILDDGNHTFVQI